MERLELSGHDEGEGRAVIEAASFAGAPQFVFIISTMQLFSYV